MNGGLFLSDIRGCWHNFTTLSINFHDFSIVFLSTTSFGGATAFSRRPCNRLNRVLAGVGLAPLPVAILDLRVNRLPRPRIWVSFPKMHRAHGRSKWEPFWVSRGRGNECQTSCSVVKSPFL